MRRRHFLAIGVAAIITCALADVAVAQNQTAETKVQPTRQPPPYWAFAVNPRVASTPAAAKSPDSSPRRVPGSVTTFTFAQIGNLFAVPDWHPESHPPMPRVVARGRKPDEFACGYCHLPNGQGRPENASVAGLPAAYIFQQLADFKTGLRKSSDPRLYPVAAMITVAHNAHDQEIQAAAAYFSGLRPKPWIRVVETKTVPKTHVAGWMLVPTRNGGREPIGQRIIEAPENLERTELRDDTAGFIAYAPVGSIKKGKTLATTGGAGKTSQCAVCHGPDLKGLNNVPSIAGRSPS
jgi:cytochrome c553